MADKLADEPAARDASFCPHFERSSCVIHFSCCEDGRFFPCHKCHNETIQKENEAALLKEWCTEDREGVGHDDNGRQDTPQADDSDLHAPHDPETSSTTEEPTQVTPGPTLPVETPCLQASTSNPVAVVENLGNSRNTETAGSGASSRQVQTTAEEPTQVTPGPSLPVETPFLQASTSNPITVEENTGGSRNTETAGSEASSRQVQTTAVNTLLAKYDAQHPDAQGKDGDRVKCTNCEHEQEISKACEKCDHVFAEYFCSECRIYVKSSMGPFHCDKCGVCRGGGKENYFHCEVCNICLAVTLKNKHKCTENSGSDLCGICFEKLFSGYVFLPCGHKLHKGCIEKLVCRGSLDCPLCRRPIFPDEEVTVKDGVWTQRLRHVLCRFGCSIMELFTQSSN